MDLPAPRDLPAGPEARDRRRWTALETANAVLGAYAVLHKAVLPWVGAAPIDPWVLFHPLFGWQLRRRNIGTLQSWSLLGAAYCLPHALAAAWSLAGSHRHWGSVSAAMTESLTLAFLLTCLLNFARPGVRKIAVFVVLGFALASARLAWTTHVTGAAHRAVPATASIRGSAPPRCPDAIRGDEIAILPCGLNAGTLPLARPLTVRNRSHRFLTLRLSVEGGDRTAPSRAVPLFPDGEWTLDPRAYRPGDRVTLGSDTTDAVGPLTLTVVGPAGDGHDR